MISAAIDWDDALVVAVSFVGASYAFWMFARAARHGWPELRAVFAAHAGLVLLYAVSYPWLMLNLDRAAAWSHWLRPVGMLSWFTQAAVARRVARHPSDVAAAIRRRDRVDT